MKFSFSNSQNSYSDCVKFQLTQGKRWFPSRKLPLVDLMSSIPSQERPPTVKSIQNYHFNSKYAR